MIPEVPEIPELQLQQLGAMRLQRPATPGLPQLRTESILGYDPRAVAAAQYAEAVRVAYEASRIQDAIMRAKARREEREEAAYYRY
tara:strand:+ start:1964 stop:2221 length:258 start_codon:yes stop_codon:yes gene_type:complete